jgi:flagellin
MDELVANINAETGGVVAASKNEDGKLVLSNNTGANITVEDDSSAAGSGFTSTAVAYKGFIKLESTDGAAIRIEAGNNGLAAVGTVADIKTLGFRQTFNTSSNDGYTTKGNALSQTGVDTAIAKGDLKINGVEIFDADITTTNFAGKLSAINSFSEQTGVTASASFSKTFAIDPDKIVAEDKIEINGTEIRAGVEPDSDATPAVAAVRTIAQLVTNINAVTAETGIKATQAGNNVTLSGDNVQALTIGYGDMATTTLESAVSAVSGIADTDRTLTIDVDDVQEGARYTITSTGADSEANTINVDYTITAADVAGGIAVTAESIANAIRGGSAAHFNTAALTTSAGVITFAGAVKDYSGETIEFKRDSTHQNIFGSAATTYASIQLDSTANTPIKIETGETNAATHEATHGFLEANVGASDFDVNKATLSAAGGTSMSGLSIATASGATKALSTLDTAIDSVSSIRGELGAVQNRLSYTTNNLSSIVTNTEGAKGRIMDADFAVETSKLAKTQILSQAATSMLAQANQSKQGILALLQ